MSNQQTLTPTPIQNSTNAIISLICGVMAWLGLFGLGGILAVIFGHVAKNEIKKNSGQISGDGMATAGLILGYANIAISILGFCLFIFIMMGLIAAPAICIPFMNEANFGFTLTP